MVEPPTKVIVNPKAGRGLALRSLGRLLKLARIRGLELSVLSTQGPGDASRLARSIVEEGGKTVLAMGGDGTVSEVINGLAGSGVALGIVPAGTGNDIARSVGVPARQLERSLEIVCRRKVRYMDVGKTGKRLFASLLGLGFASLVAKEANRIRILRGPIVFPIALYKVLKQLKPVPVHLVLDDRSLRFNCISVMVQNTPSTGGGLLIAPEAKIDDGFLDVVIVKGIGKLGLMWNFPKLYKGSHLDHPAFSVYRVRRARIESMEQLDTVIDGDLVGSTPVDVEVVPKAVRIIGS